MTSRVVTMASRRVGARRTFLVTFAIVFLLSALWSVATPLFASPDEPVHVVKAAAVVRGELLGNLARGPASPFGLVRVPEYYALLRWPGSDPAHSRLCFHSRPDVPASCVIPADEGPSQAAIVAGATRQAWIYNVRYPPLYYAIVGLPTLLWSGNGALYLMRLLSAAICALFIALAAACARRYSSRRFIGAGLVLATTPMVFFLGGVVNPTGFEVATAICAWCTGAIAVLEYPAGPPRALLVCFTASASVFVLVRSLSPFWLALIALTLLAMADWRELLRAFKRRDVKIALGVIVVFSCLAATWVLKENATAVYSSATQAAAQVPPGTSTLHILTTSFSRNAFYIPDMIGVFGWFDTRAPSFTYLGWYCLIGLAVLQAWRDAGLRRAIVLGSLVVAVVLVPPLISASQARSSGYIWSGRDALALAVGLPLLASMLFELRIAPRRRAGLLACGLAVASVAQFLAFYQALRRYAVGAHGPLFSFITHPSWHPPIAIGVLLVGELAVLALGAVGVVRLVRAMGRQVSGEDRQSPSPSPTSQPASSALVGSRAQLA
jgi:hypothetical protein